MLMTAPAAGDTFTGHSGVTYTAGASAILEIGGGDVRRALLRNWTPNSAAAPVTVGASRNLLAIDNGQTLECTASGLTLTVPTGLGATFGCAVSPKGTTSIASAGAPLLIGATTTVTRTDTANVMFAVVVRPSTLDSYVVTGS